jgi:predicted MFS family arabinose efflux permease
MFANTLAPILARRGIHYGWVMLALTFLTTLSTASVMGVPGVFMTPLKDEFGWSTADISGPLGLRMALFGLIAPFAAALIQRHGVRTMVGVSIAMLVAGVAISSQMTALWQLWLSWGLLLGTAAGMTAMVLGATVANRWFTARRGLAIGLLTASNATGQLIFMPAAAWLAAHAGWRIALLPSLGMCLFSLALMLLFGCNHPALLNIAPYGQTALVPLPPRNVHGAVRTSLGALREGSKSVTFWVLFGTFFVCGMSTYGIIQTHFIPLCHDFGMEAVAAASVLAMIGAFDFIGTIASGWLSDRYDNRWLLFWYYGLRGVSLLMLPYSTFSFVGLSMFAVFYGLDWVATVPPTVRLAGMGFGREKAPLMFGWIFAGHQLGSAFGATVTGISRDALSSYLPAFFVTGLVCLAAAVLIVAVRRPAPVVAA